jgi:hypothetical protein
MPLVAATNNLLKCAGGGCLHGASPATLTNRAQQRDVTVSGHG